MHRPARCNEREYLEGEAVSDLGFPGQDRPTPVRHRQGEALPETGLERRWVGGAGGRKRRG